MARMPNSASRKSRTPPAPIRAMTITSTSISTRRSLKSPQGILSLASSGQARCGRSSSRMLTCGASTCGCRPRCAGSQNRSRASTPLRRSVQDAAHGARADAKHDGYYYRRRAARPGEHRGGALLRPGGYYVIEDIEWRRPSERPFLAWLWHAISWGGGDLHLLQTPLKPETTRLLHENHAFFVDTLFGHRNFTAMRKAGAGSGASTFWPWAGGLDARQQPPQFARRRHPEAIRRPPGTAV